MEGGDGGTTPHRHIKRKTNNYQRVLFFYFFFFLLQETRMPLSSFTPVSIYVLNNFFFFLEGFPPSLFLPFFFSPSQRRALYSSVGMVISPLSEAPSSRCTSSAAHWSRVSFSSSDVRKSPVLHSTSSWSECESLRVGNDTCRAFFPKAHVPTLYTTTAIQSLLVLFLVVTVL